MKSAESKSTKCKSTFFSSCPDVVQELTKACDDCGISFSKEDITTLTNGYYHDLKEYDEPTARAYVATSVYNRCCDYANMASAGAEVYGDAAADRKIASYAPAAKKALEIMKDSVDKGSEGAKKLWDLTQGKPCPRYKLS